MNQGVLFDVDDDSQERLDAIRDRLLHCELCSLHSRRKKAVVSISPTHARFMFVGEGPGENEDRTGAPFVGKAGELLDRMIMSMRLKRDEVFIDNIVKCRPPKNREPENDEAVCCFAHLKEQIGIVKPELIIALGSTAANMFRYGHVAIESINKIRRMGFFSTTHSCKVKVVATYHPAYLLRMPDKKSIVWNDLQKIMQEFSL